jgi:predicted enzyme related to lactoylglutathione lyase
MRMPFASPLVAVALVAGVGCATTVRLPVLVDPPTGEHHVGKVIFVELLTPDVAASERFYAGVFGWTFTDTQLRSTVYAEASLDGHPVAGLMQKALPAGEHRQPAWLTFIAVREVDEAEKIALEHGAKLLFGPRSMPGRGREAVFADPQGAVFAVLASSTGDPPDVLAANGEWIWSSLITSNPDTDAAFYQAVFAYEVFDMPADPGAQHLMFASDDYSRASANTLPANRPQSRPHWLNYVRVEDADGTIAKVVALGGRVLVEPRVDRHGGRVAVVADPLGTPFGLLEWPDTERKEATK